jgi:large subunit ribosomal protein L21e
MATRIGGFRRKTRHKLAKSRSQKGKISLTKYLQKLDIGQRVVLKAEPAVQKGMYFPRFHGLTGIVNGMKGRCYEVLIKDQNKPKTIIVHPVHIKKV